MSAPADVLAVMDASGSLLRLRVAKCNTAANKEVLAGREPHHVLLHTQARAVYLLECHNAARAAVAELIEADKEYEAARRDWDHVTAHDPEETSDETWARVADRFEAAVMRRAAALARVGGVA